MDDVIKWLIVLTICVTIGVLSWGGFLYFNEKHFAENGYEQVMGVGRMTPIGRRLKGVSMIEYLLIEMSGDVIGFTDHVNKMLTTGWELHGGTFVNSTPMNPKEISAGSVANYYQAMVREVVADVPTQEPDWDAVG